MSSPLSIYLRNHEAAAQAGRDLFHRAASNHQHETYGADLRDLAAEVREDLRSLRELMDDLDVRPDRLLGTVLRAGERVARLKPNGHLLQRSPLTPLIEVEGLLDAVRAKGAGWQALLAAGVHSERVDIGEMLRRAEDQASRLTDIHQAWPPSSPRIDRTPPTRVRMELAGATMSQWARVARILAALHDSGRADGDNVAVRLVMASRDALPVTGVGLSWVTPHGPGATLAATDGPARLMEELQFSLGEGPCVDSSRSGFPVLQADLAQTAATLWPAFRPRALDAGIAAVFAFPLQVGAVRMGVLDLYRDVAGPLADGDVDEALAYAAAATAVLLELQARLRTRRRPSVPGWTACTTAPRSIRPAE